MSEAQSGSVIILLVHNGIGSLDDVAEQSLHLERCFLARIVRGSKLGVEPHVVQFPQVVGFILGEVMPQVRCSVVALHVAAHLEHPSHQALAVYFVACVSLVVEQEFAEALGMHQLFAPLLLQSLAAFFSLLHVVGWVGCQIPLVCGAHVIVHEQVGEVACQLLTLGFHAQDAAYDHGASCIHPRVLGVEHLGEVPGHASAYAVMLVFTLGGEFAYAPFGTLVKLLHCAEQLLSLGGQFALLACCLQGFHHILVLPIATQPAASVAGIIGEIKGFVAFGSWCELLGGSGVGGVIASAQVSVAVDSLACFCPIVALGRNNAGSPYGCQHYECIESVALHVSFV